MTGEKLKEIRKEARRQMSPRLHAQGFQVAVGMGACGIAAGARQVMNALLEEIKEREIEDIKVYQTDCMGNCALEPMVEVISPNGEKITYVQIDPEKMRRIVEEHLIGQKPVTEYTLVQREK